MTDYDDAPGAADRDNTEADDGASTTAPTSDAHEVEPTETPDGTNVGA